MPPTEPTSFLLPVGLDRYEDGRAETARGADSHEWCGAHRPDSLWAANEVARRSLLGPGARGRGSAGRQAHRCPEERLGRVAPAERRVDKGLQALGVVRHG